ncbi:MAG: Isovaleryl-CoA dehydrogenase 1, partial [Acidimicrobiia bacterium]|nr:Isovaleryl-CoA dehydrogenase 1 [Acidimicrobiia bacterium]
MSIAISDDHRALADTARDFLATHKARLAARALLDSDTEELPAFWDEMARIGWLGLHLPEAHGGSGYGLGELVVVVEQLGKADAPGPFVPTVLTSAIVNACGTDSQKARLLPGLSDGTIVATVGFSGDVQRDGVTVNGDGGVVLSASLANVLLLTVGDDLVIVDARAAGVSIDVPANVDLARRSGRVRVSNVTLSDDSVLVGARTTALAFARTIFAAEAAGVARECVEASTEYAKVREQFGRPIATFQAVKHHCANMLVASELATAAVWDAARAADSGGEQFELAAAVAASLAVPTAYESAQLNIQVHGGIGYTWEHDAHLLLRRAIAIGGLVDAEAASCDVTRFTQQGVRRQVALELPPEAEAMRAEIAAVAQRLGGLDRKEQRRRLIDEGYVMPHWPKPWGLEAGAVEQLVIEEEFSAAKVERPQYGITGWVILTLIQHGTEDQVNRWVRKALEQEEIWCQLFSEPDAGSDAAAVKTRATRVDGGWLVNGQKVWTSGARVCRRGLATVRTDFEARKHAGITTMVIDMHGPGVDIRPLRQNTGDSEFNEVFLTDVFVPDDDVVGPVNQGWTVARATLGNERVSIGGGVGGGLMGLDFAAAVAATPERLPGGVGRVGRFYAVDHTLRLVNLRAAQRAVIGAGPGPEGNVTKLV